MLYDHLSVDERNVIYQMPFWAIRTPKWPLFRLPSQYHRAGV